MWWKIYLGYILCLNPGRFSGRSDVREKRQKRITSRIIAWTTITIKFSFIDIRNQSVKTASVHLVIAVDGLVNFQSDISDMLSLRSLSDIQKKIFSGESDTWICNGRCQNFHFDFYLHIHITSSHQSKNCTGQSGTRQGDFTQGYCYKKERPELNSTGTKGRGCFKSWGWRDLRPLFCVCPRKSQPSHIFMTRGSFTTWNELATEKKLKPTLPQRLDHSSYWYDLAVCPHPNLMWNCSPQC